MEFLGIGCLMVAGYPFFFVVWLAMISLIRSKYNWLRGIVSIPISVVVYFVAFMTALSIYLEAITYYRSRPNVIFADSFGFSPTPDVQILNSSRNSPTKWDVVYLEFDADPATVNRILQKGFARIQAKDIIERYDAPPWWTPNTIKAGVLIYATGTAEREYRGEYRYFFNHDLLIYDPQTKHAYFRFRR
jgi:hypothetical protein